MRGEKVAQRPNVRPRRSGATVALTIASPPGTSSAPPTPCAARAAISPPSELAAPHTIDAPTKIAVPMR